MLSDWRAVLLLRKASTEIPITDRRWKTPPRNVVEIRPILNRLSKAGELVPLESFPFLYRVNAPYARTEAVEEEEVLMELHPYAALSYISALTFHQMTEQLTKDTPSWPCSITTSPPARQCSMAKSQCSTKKASRGFT